MIKWNTNMSDGQRKKKINAALSDLKICEACINDPDIFERYLMLLEDGQELDKKFPASVQHRILDGINKLNWTDFDFSIKNKFYD